MVSAQVGAVTSHAAHVPLQPGDDSAARGLPRGVAIAVTAVSALVFYGLTTHGSFNPFFEQTQSGFADRFFFAQAHALLQGHLNVAPAQIPSECWVHQGRCYGYFGLTPSLLRIPFLPLLDDANRSFTAVYMTVALTLAVGSSLAVASHTLARVQRTRFLNYLGVALALSLGPASVLVMIARPAVYEEAIAWSVAFGLLGVYCFLRWWSTGGRGWAALLILSLVLSAGARPTTVALGAFLGIGIVVRAALGRRQPAQVSTLFFGAVVIVLPVAACVGVYWLKFHALVPNSLLNQQIGGPAVAPWWLSIRRVDHNHLQGFRFVPTALVAYLRPDGVALSSSFPFVNFRFGPTAGTRFIGIPAGSFYVEPFSTLPDDMPFATAVLIAGFLYGVKEARSRAIGLGVLLGELARSPLTYCILGTAGVCGIMLTQGVITNRYLGDIFPLVAVALPVAARFLASPAARLSGRAELAVACLVSLLVAWALLANLGLEYLSWWHTTT